MDNSAAKKLWWALLVTGIGAFGLFVLVLATEGRIPRPGLLAIPISGFLLTSFSVYRLRACYKAAPLEKNARWHLSIKDFLALTFFEGLLLSIFKVAIPEHFFKLGIPFALVIAAVCIPGALVASYKGIDAPLARSLYAGGFSMMVVGGLMSGGLIFLIAVICIVEGMNPMEPFRDILGFGRSSSDWGIVMFRLGLIFLIAGFVACRLAGGGREKPSS